MTGWGRGYCGTGTTTGYQGYRGLGRGGLPWGGGRGYGWGGGRGHGWGGGRGYGWGGGRGRGWGWGYGRGWGAGWAPWGADPAAYAPPDAKTEASWLQDEAAAMEQELTRIRERLSALEKEPESE